MSNFIDFAAIKERVGIADAVQAFGVKLNGKGDQLRGACPACQSGGDRAFSVNTTKKSFFCFPASKGGDCIAAVAHLRGIGQRQAAELIQDHFGEPSEPVRPQKPAVSATSPPEKVVPGERGGFQALDYLVFDHPEVEKLGLPALTAAALGIGFCPKGTMRGCIAIPVYVPGGADPSGYIGLDFENGSVKLPKEWHGLPAKPALQPEPAPDSNTTVVPFRRRA